MMDGAVEVPTFTLEIVYKPGEKPIVTGPLADKMLCYAMLEAARDAIHDFVVPKILAPHQGLKIAK